MTCSRCQAAQHAVLGRAVQAVQAVAAAHAEAAAASVGLQQAVVGVPCRHMLWRAAALWQRRMLKLLLLLPWRAEVWWAVLCRGCVAFDGSSGALPGICCCSGTAVHGVGGCTVALGWDKQFKHCSSVSSRRAL